MAKGGEGGFSSFGDMFDGGGAGAMGDTFQGGPFSGLLNDIGIKPHGYWDRQEGMGSVSPPAGRVSTSSQAPVYSGRGDAGMPERPLTYSGRGDAGMPQRPMQYSGRGDYGMPPMLPQEEEAPAAPDLMSMMQMDEQRRMKAIQDYLDSVGYGQ